ncbi:type III-B CRISPR module RAMP protein Cmr4 [Paenibacillus pabuli]|uniref:type III-B CRISPR module RAMP protein Cmr4 n=1 Tax=Paenibacillus pabuli TaxID=1472 RepID=UPI0020002FE9|nr:type III-B CRISPR module RAMP protein Cmr4 [Paenibacillus pabuli]UPK45003.1 type III-B CRISPR module RAMP protein Cmr4 [Paenibacillus pabuli]
MFTKYQPFLLYAVTSVHAGSGSEIGIVDLPIQREKHTAYPKIESSTLKGSWRRYVAEGVGNDPQEVADFSAVFGSAPREDETNESQASAVSFLDARILLFPVRSMRGTFAWITCPYVLKRFNREMNMLNAARSEDISQWLLPTGVPGSVSGKALLVDADSSSKGNKSQIVLEEYTFEVSATEAAKELAGKLDRLLSQDGESIGVEERLVILSDDEFADFVEMSTEVNARIRVEDNGQVDGGLWYEENIPPETVFYSAILFGNPREPQRYVKVTKDSDKAAIHSTLKSADDVENYIIRDKFPEVFQLGSSYTIGKGIMRNIRLKEGS